MCGILGTSPKTDTSFFQKALNTLFHRGPDDYGIWNEDLISLGHRRLSILDLSQNGRQPMAYAGNRYHIVFNGEIYNFLEIREELIKKGHRFMSESDTEVILASYAEWGNRCLDKFNGMWALAIWDNIEGKLFLSRDRFGKKPLFYAIVNNTFIFASEMKAIFPFLNYIKPSQDFQWMAQNIFSYENTDKCLIEGIKRFPAGYYGYYNNETLSLYRYWNTLDHLKIPSKKYSDQVLEFRNLFIDACKIRMRSDVPIGTALSGGLDSSATISTMAYISGNINQERVSKDWQHAFVATFPGTPIDESYYAKKVVDYLGIEATYIDIDPLLCWDKIYDYLYNFEELYITSPIPMIMTYGAVKKHGVTVTIDGHGADELFSGYGNLVEALWDAGINFKKAADILKILSDTEDINTNQTIRKSRTNRYIKYMLKTVLKKMLGIGYKSIDHLHSGFKRMDNFTQSLYVIFHETILPTLLRNYDRYSMMNGVEIRMPFMDYRIVSYIFSLSFDSKFGDGYTKKLVRDSLAAFMPYEIAYRKSKIGFNSPIVDWMQGPLKEFFEDTVNSSDFIQCELINNPEGLRDKLIKITKGKDSSWLNAECVWTDFIPYMWEKAIIKRSYEWIRPQ